MYHIDKTSGLPSNEVLQLGQDEEGFIWITTYDGVYRYDGYDFLPSEIDKSGDIAFHLTDDSIRHFLSVHKLLLKDDLTDIMVDREGNYWLSTNGHGIYIMPSSDNIVYTASNSTLDTSAVKILVTFENALYLVSAGGMVMAIDTGGDHYPVTRLPEQNPVSAAQDKWNERILLSMGKNYSIDIKTGKYASDIPYLDATDISLTEEDILFTATLTDARFYALTRDAYYSGFFDSSWQANYHFNQQEGISYIILRNREAQTIWYDSSGNSIYTGYTDGLYYYSNAMNNQVFDLDDSSAIYPSDISQTSDGIVWISTSSNGLYALQDGEVISHYTVINGLLSNSCGRIVPVGNNLWFSTEKGIEFFDRQNNSIKAFTPGDGLLSVNIADLAIFDNRLFIATDKGLQVIPLDFENFNAVPPPVYIKSVSLHEQPLAHSDTYKFTHRNNDIRIEFHGLTFSSNGNFSYRYRLLGMDTAWTNLPAKINFVHYPALAPGEYTFQVIAVNEDGVASLEPAEIQITIARPFWLRIWFILLCVSALSAAILFIRRSHKTRASI